MLKCLMYPIFNAKRGRIGQEVDNNKERKADHSCIPHATKELIRGGSYFPYILLNEIETMFSQLAKQSHWKLSADSSIAHEHILPVNLPVNTFSNGN